MDFVGMEVRTAAEQRQAEEQQRRQDMMRAQRLDSCLKEITGNEKHGQWRTAVLGWDLKVPPPPNLCV